MGRNKKTEEKTERTIKAEIPDPTWNGKEWNYYGRNIDDIPASVHNFEAIFGMPPLDGKEHKESRSNETEDLW